LHPRSTIRRNPPCVLGHGDLDLTVISIGHWNPLNTISVLMGWLGEVAPKVDYATERTCRRHRDLDRDGRPDPRRQPEFGTLRPLDWLVDSHPGRLCTRSRVDSCRWRSRRRRPPGYAVANGTSDGPGDPGTVGGTLGTDGLRRQRYRLDTADVATPI
jgi:hypothetical protein